MKKLKFLIVEDETLIALHLKMKLSRAGHIICGLAVSGDEAVHLAHRESPEVVLMDIRLLGAMDGIEAAQQICTFLSTLIIFTTGYADPVLKERALALNPAGYLVKPVDLPQIQAILEPLYGSA
jgi:CheY-like chemotaxis protein